MGVPYEGGVGLQLRRLTAKTLCLSVMVVHAQDCELVV